MGQLIHVTATPAAILADARTTVKEASHLGGDWARLADHHIIDSLARATVQEKALARSVTELADAKRASERFVRTLELQLGRIHDAIWNDLGRPAHDSQLAEFFPQGCHTATDGRADDIPMKLEILADLLEAVEHPMLSAEWCKTRAAEVREAREEIVEAAAAIARARVQMTKHAQLLRSRARTAHTQLGLYKKALLALRFRQDQIHRVIPDRSGPAPRPAVAVGEEDEEIPAGQAPNGQDVETPEAEPSVQMTPEAAAPAAAAPKGPTSPPPADAAADETEPESKAA